MVYKKVGGSICNGCDFESKCFGVKWYGGQVVKVGNIIVCQCGIQFYLGVNIGLGKDYMIYVKVDGVVKFQVKGFKSCRFIIIEFVVQFLVLF